MAILNTKGEPSAPPRSYQATAYQGTGGWDPYSGEWVQGDIFPLDGVMATITHAQRIRLPMILECIFMESEVDGLSRKRRRDQTKMMIIVLRINGKVA